VDLNLVGLQLLLDTLYKDYSSLVFMNFSKTTTVIWLDKRTLESTKSIFGSLVLLLLNFFADIALCPMEMVKVKIQTSPAGTFPTQLGPAVSALQANPSSRFPFGSVTPLWGRQIPYTMAKFFFFELIVQQFYSKVFTNPKESYSKSTQLGITFASGYLAGVICAIVSHPADSLVSLMGKEVNKGKSLGTIASEQGAFNLMTKGLGTRIIMIGTLTGLQWWIYDSFKSSMGMGTTGGK